MVSTETRPGCLWVGFPFDVSVHENSDPWNILSTIWSFVPNGFVIVMTILSLITRRVFIIMIAVYTIWVAAINEIIAQIIGQRRPSYTCAPDGGVGMPSGHADHNATMIIWMSWEILTNPRLNKWHWWQRILLLIVPLFIWGPSIPARWYIGDHSWTQLGVGCALGVFWDVVWISFLYFYWRPVGLWKFLNTNCAKRFKIRNDYLPGGNEQAERAFSPRLMPNKALGPEGDGEAAESVPEEENKDTPMKPLNIV